MKPIKPFIWIILLSFFISILYIPPFYSQTQEWIAPLESNKIVNPLKGDISSIAEGKNLYTTYCVPCHGEKGKGDGPASESIKTKPADHSSGKIQRQSDGALFWKLTEGNPEFDMISYKFVLSETERWQIVNYIRTLNGDKKRKYINE